MGDLLIWLHVGGRDHVRKQSKVESIVMSRGRQKHCKGRGKTPCSCLVHKRRQRSRMVVVEAGGMQHHAALIICDAMEEVGTKET